MPEEIPHHLELLSLVFNEEKKFLFNFLRVEERI
jgi:hypothetical protein